MATKRNLKEIEFEYTDDNDKTEIFVVREPTVEENNAADLIRSNAFFEAVDKGIRTETEILSRLREQGRFNEDDYREECDRLGAELRDLLIELATATSKEQLIEIHRKTREAREALMDKYRWKENFLQHSAEQKGENAVNLALLGVCLERKDGTPVFAMVKKDTNELDIESTYKKVYNHDNNNFITRALSYFLPLLMGVDRDVIKEHTEDSVFKDRMLKLTGEKNVTPPITIGKKQSQYSPVKEENKKVVAAPPREKPETQTVEVNGKKYHMGVDMAKEDIEPEVPSFDLEVPTEETPAEPSNEIKEAKSAPVAPTFETVEAPIQPTEEIPEEPEEEEEEIEKLGEADSSVGVRADVQKATVTNGSGKPDTTWRPDPLRVR